MKISITWQLLDREAILPLSYKYEISSWLYRLMQKGNPVFSSFLHEHGFDHGHRKFKFFTFSDLKIPANARRIEGDRLIITCPAIHLHVSMYHPRTTDALLAGLLRGEDQIVLIGDIVSKGRFRLTATESLLLDIPAGPVHLRTDSPLVLDDPNHLDAHKSLPPDDPRFGEVLIDNLLKKYQTAFEHGLTRELVLGSRPTFRLVDRPIVRKKIVIKAHTPAEHKIEGYFCDFVLDAPRPIVELGLLAGFGSQNPQGFGATRIVRKP